MTMSAFLGLLSISMPICSLLSGTPAAVKLLFCIYVCLMFFNLGGLFVMAPSAIGKAFGLRHFGVNYGMILTFSVRNSSCCIARAPKVEVADGSMSRPSRGKCLCPDRPRWKDLMSRLSCVHVDVRDFLDVSRLCNFERVHSPRAFIGMDIIASVWNLNTPPPPLPPRIIDAAFIHNYHSQVL